jgi:mono/diheme cytochrome c family protein
MARIVYRILAGVGVIALAGLALSVLALRQSRLSTLAEPGKVEVGLARFARGMAIPDDVRDRPNPLQATSEIIADARVHFADHCASCHGNDGSGQTGLGRRLYPRAPDMRLAATQSLSDGEIFHVIEHGVRFTGMPGWGGEVSPEASWKLVLFVRHLPSLTPKEILEMEQLNPRTPSEWRELQRDQEFLEGNPPGATPPDRHVH